MSNLKLGIATYVLRLAQWKGVARSSGFTWRGIRFKVSEQTSTSVTYQTKILWYGWIYWLTVAAIAEIRSAISDKKVIGR